MMFTKLKLIVCLLGILKICCGFSSLYDRKSRRNFVPVTSMFESSNGNGDNDPNPSVQEVTESLPSNPVKCPDCDECDGSGRVAGGIGAVFSWIPIKAYRPCPTYIERGGVYQKTGQGLDEIAFGRDSTFEK